MDAKLFTEGSIYYYENISNIKKDYEEESKNHDFLVSRPVYILDSRPLPFDTYKINVLVITSSSKRIGIDINIDGKRAGKVLPYHIHAVSPKYLVRYMGQVPDQMKDEIRQALEYHIGFNALKPRYLKEYEEYINHKEEFVNSKLTVKELVLYELLENQCKFKDNYYVTYEEFYNTYKKRVPRNAYSRKCDLTKALMKLQEIYPEVSIKETNHQRVLYGISFKSNIHKLDSQYTSPVKQGVIATDDPCKGLDLTSLSKQQLLKLLSPAQKKVYDKLDIINKLINSKKDFREFDFAVSDDFNGKVMKQLIAVDLGIKFNALRSKLRSGDSPYEMSQVNQFLIYHMSNEEIFESVNPKYYKKGLQVLKKTLKQNCRWMFNNLESK